MLPSQSLRVGDDDKKARNQCHFGVYAVAISLVSFPLIALTQPISISANYPTFHFSTPLGLGFFTNTLGGTLAVPFIINKRRERRSRRKLAFFERAYTGPHVADTISTKRLQHYITERAEWVTQQLERQWRISTHSKVNFLRHLHPSTSAEVDRYIVAEEPVLRKAENCRVWILNFTSFRRAVQLIMRSFGAPTAHVSSREVL